MSTSMYSRTSIVSTDTQSMSITSADELMTVPSLKIEPKIGLKVISQRVVTEVRGNARRDYLAYSLQRLCELAKVSELGFMHSGDGENAHWKLPLGIEDGEEEVYGHACGFLLDGADRGSAYAALTVLLHWIEENFDSVSQEEFVAYYMGREDARESFEESKRFLYANASDSAGADDGDGPGFLFAYLTSAREVMGNAVIAKYPVLHVREILF